MDSNTIQFIPVTQIRPNPWNRTVFDPQGLEDLAASIRSEGIEEPLIVRKLGESQYELASGHRRWLASQKVGLKEVPCWVRNLPDKEVAELNVTANIQREAIPPLELARMVKDYMERFGTTQKRTAEEFGKSQAWVSDLTSFIKLPPAVLENIRALIMGWDPLVALRSAPADVQLKVSGELKAGTIKPEQVEKRCNQLRFTNDRNAESKRKKKSDPVDPIADFWPPLTLRSLAEGKAWGVRYGTQAIPGLPGVSMPAWQFWVVDNGHTPKQDLKQWFLKMAAQMDDSDTPLGTVPNESLDLSDSQRYWMPQSAAEMEQMEKEGAAARLPQTREEQAELERLAATQGPAAVYEWVFGKGGYYASKAAGKTWQELAVDNPTQAIKDLVATLKVVGNG